MDQGFSLSWQSSGDIKALQRILGRRKEINKSGMEISHENDVIRNIMNIHNAHGNAKIKLILYN